MILSLNCELVVKALQNVFKELAIRMDRLSAAIVPFNPLNTTRLQSLRDLGTLNPAFALTTFAGKVVNGLFGIIPRTYEAFFGSSEDARLRREITVAQLAQERNKNEMIRGTIQVGQQYSEIALQNVGLDVERKQVELAHLTHTNARHENEEMQLHDAIMQRHVLEHEYYQHRLQQETQLHQLALSQHENVQRQNEQQLSQSAEHHELELQLLSQQQSHEARKMQLYECQVENRIKREKQVAECEMVESKELAQYNKDLHQLSLQQAEQQLLGGKRRQSREEEIHLAAQKLLAVELRSKQRQMELSEQSANAQMNRERVLNELELGRALKDSEFRDRLNEINLKRAEMELVREREKFEFERQQLAYETVVVKEKSKCQLKKLLRSSSGKSKKSGKAKLKSTKTMTNEPEDEEMEQILKAEVAETLNLTTRMCYT